MKYSMPEAIAAIASELRTKSKASSLFETLAADYRAADAARNDLDAKFRMLESVGIDTVALIERVERGGINNGTALRLSAWPERRGLDGMCVYFGERCVALDVGIGEESSDLRDHATSLSRCVAALTRCVRSGADLPEPTRSAVPDLLADAFVGLEFLGSFVAGLLDASSAREARAGCDPA